MEFKVSIPASELAAIATGNKQKALDFVVDEWSKAITEASKEGQREVFIPVPSEEYFCCEATELAMRMFREKGYSCSKSSSIYDDLCIRIEW